MADVKVALGPLSFFRSVSVSAWAQHVHSKDWRHSLHVSTTGQAMIACAKGLGGHTGLEQIGEALVAETMTTFEAESRLTKVLDGMRPGLMAEATALGLGCDRYTIADGTEPTAVRYTHDVQFGPLHFDRFTPKPCTPPCSKSFGVDVRMWPNQCNALASAPVAADDQLFLYIHCKFPYANNKLLREYCNSVGRRLSDFILDSYGFEPSNKDDIEAIEVFYDEHGVGFSADTPLHNKSVVDVFDATFNYY